MSPSASTVSYTALKPPYHSDVRFYSVHSKKSVMTFDCAGHLCHMLAGGADVMVWQSVCLYRLSLLYSQGPPTGCTDICGSSKAHPALIPLWWAVCSCSLPCVRGLKVTVKIPAVPRICHIRWPLFLCLQCTSPQLEDLHIGPAIATQLTVRWRKRYVRWHQLNSNKKKGFESVPKICCGLTGRIIWQCC